MRLTYSMMIAVLLLAASSVKAQPEVAIGVRGGLNIPKITVGGTKTPLSEGYSSRMAWGSGVFTELRFNRTFSLQIGLEYSGQGGQKDGMQAIPPGPIFARMAVAFADNPQTAPLVPVVPAAANFAPQYLYADFKSVAKFNYLMLPVQAKFGWNLSPTSPFRVYVGAGLFCAYLLSGERVSSGSSKFYADSNQGTLTAYWTGYDKTGLDMQTIMGVAGVYGAMDAMPAQSMNSTQDITDDLYRFNFGFIGNAGVSYTFSRKHALFIEGGGNYGFIKIQKKENNGQNRIGAGTVMLGYSYTLGKK